MGARDKGAKPWAKVMVDTANKVEAFQSQDQLSGSLGLSLGCGTRTR